MAKKDKTQNELTNAQRAAIYLHVFGGVKDRKVLFTIAEGSQRLEKLKESSVNVTLFKWFNSSLIQEGIKEAQFKLFEIENNLKEKVKNELLETENGKKDTQKGKPEPVNFLNLDEFLAFANDQANKITDEKERRSWVELIGKYKNFREGETDDQQQIRAYLPISCEDCELKKRCERCIYDVCPVQTL